jgi:histidine triad (HIT) family protein
MEKTIFEKIIDREIPASVVYEDNKCMCIVDKFPSHEGQLVLFPKLVRDKIIDLPEDIYIHLWNMVKKLGKALEKSYPGTRFCLITEGFEVSHAHIRLYPVEGENFVALPNRNEIFDDKLKEIQKKIKNSL